jgi:hypothetical protein
MYISQQANKIGMTSESLIERLPENYSLNDIDNLVESLFNAKRKVNMLPISSPVFKNTKKVFHESSSNLNESTGGLSVVRSMLQQMK